MGICCYSDNSVESECEQMVIHKLFQSDTLMM